MAKTIFVEIVGNASQFKKELDSAVLSTNKANSGFSKMSKVAGIAGLALAGGLAVGLEKSVHAAMDAEVSTSRMDKAFQNAHVSTKAFADQITEAESAGRKLGFTNTDVRNSLGSLVTATHSGRKAMTDLSLAEDVARFKHVDLTEASKMLTSTLAGNVRSAKALGIILLPVTSNMDALRAKYKELGEEIPKAEERSARFADKQATAAQALDKVTAAVHGQAGAFADTAAGGMAQFHAQVDNLEEKLGAGLLPAITAIIDKLSLFAAFLSTHTAAAKAFEIGLAGLAAALLAVGAASAIAAIGLTGGIAAAVVGVTAGIVLLIQHFDQVKAALANLGAWIQGHAYVLLAVPIIGPFLAAAVAAKAHLHDIEAATQTAMAVVRDKTTAGMAAVLAAFRTGWAAAVAVTQAAVGAASAAATAVGHGIVAGVKAGLDTMLAAVRGVFSRLWGMIRGLAGEAASAAASIGQGITSGVLSGLSGLAGSLISSLKDKVMGGLNSVKHLLHIGSPSLVFAEEVGKPIIQGIILGMEQQLKPLLTSAVKLAIATKQGFVAATHPLFQDALAGAKANADTWAASDGTSNMLGVGSMLGQKFIEGLANSVKFQGAAALAGAFSSPTSPVGIGAAIGPTSSPLGVGAAGPTNVYVNVGTLAGSSVPELAETIRRELLRVSSRNGSVGLS